MSKILIADASKPSLVMSSEVFKDKMPGTLILVATTGKETIEILQNDTPDMCVIDFDLPDVDGVTLIAAMRKHYKGPILLTAYPDPIVYEAVASDLFAFNDAGGWIPKPVKFDVLSEKIDRFLNEKYRLGKRFETELTTLLVGKGAGRGKRAPKANGKIINISLGGACVALNEPMTMKSGEELTFTVSIPLPPKPQVAKKLSAKEKRAGAKASETKIKATVAWVTKDASTAGFQFTRLSEVQKRGLETLLRESPTLA